MTTPNNGEPVVICRITRTQQPFSVNDIVIRRNETNYLHNGRAINVGTYISVMWYHKNADIAETPREQLMHYDEWIALQERQKQARNYWSMPPAEQEKIRK